MIMWVWEVEGVGGRVGFLVGKKREKKKGGGCSSDGVGWMDRAWEMRVGEGFAIDGLFFCVFLSNFFFVGVRITTEDLPECIYVRRLFIFFVCGHHFIIACIASRP